MSEFYMNYFEINQRKNQVIHTANGVNKLENQFHSVSSLLKHEQGLGIEEITERINKLAKKSEKIAEALKQIGKFLEEVIKQTEKADLDAKKIFEDFSVREEEKEATLFKKFAKYIVSILSTLAGAVVSDNPAATWIIGIIGALGNGLDGISFENAATEVIKALSKFDLGQLLKNLCGAGAITGKTIAGWFVDFYEDAVENFSDGEGSFTDDLIETGAEGLAGGLLYGTAAVVTAAVAALLGLASGGVGIAIAGTISVIVVKWAADFVSEIVFQNEEGFVENAGDVLCNWEEQLFG